MRKHLLALVVSGSLLTGSAFAGGQPFYGKQVTPPAPAPEMEAAFGTRFYLGAQGGITVENKTGEIGGYGGIKGGYVFGTAKVRPAIEADLFYDYVRIGAENEDEEDAAKFNTGAFMGNFLVRFSMGRFQPFVGGGVGGYYGEGEDAKGEKIKTEDNKNNSGFAWQLIAGADYYFTERMSIFAEYKFLNYEDFEAPFVKDRLSQHLIGLGVRVHF